MAVRFLPLATIQSNRVCDWSVVRKVSTRTASRSPQMSVDEFATHISSSLPGGKSRTRPGRFIVSTFHRRSVFVFIVGFFSGCETFAISELAWAEAPLNRDLGH